MLQATLIHPRSELIEVRFQRFIHLLSFLLSPSCWTAGFDTMLSRHNKGSILRFLYDGKTMQESQILNWQNDTEHGLFHGVITAFFAFDYKYGYIPDSVFKNISSTSKSSETERIRACSWPVSDEERLIASCLFHDLARFAQDNNHDVALKELMPNLIPETYSHSNPGDNKNPLVIGDRTELRRYDDHNKWCKHTETLKYYNPIFLDRFYKYTRPALRTLYEGRNELWIRHFPDKERYWTKDDCYDRLPVKRYPPVGGYWVSLENEPNRFPVELGKIPFEGHMSFQNSFVPHGVITLKKAKLNSSVKRTMTPCARKFDKETPFPDNLDGRWTRESFKSREHPCVDTDVPLNEWVFIYDKKHCKSNPIMTNLMDNSKGFVTWQLVNNFLKTLNGISELAFALKT